MGTGTLIQIQVAMLRFLSAIILLAIGFNIISCDVNSNDKFTDHYSYQFQNNAAIKKDSLVRKITADSTDTLVYYKVEQGKNIVFTYGHEIIAPKGFLDAGFSETLVFEIPSDSDSFELTDQDFNDGTAFYGRSCFCEPIKAPPQIRGTIYGERLSAAHWLINADVMIIGLSKHISFEEPFYKK